MTVRNWDEMADWLDDQRQKYDEEILRNVPGAGS